MSKAAPGAKRGLPQQVKMRHAAHFVDELATHSSPPIGRLLALSAIQPDPNQPRTSTGDLSELVASIRERGVLEPILVRPMDGPNPDGARYLIISGERRYRAALEAGHYEIPAIEMDVSPQEALEIALVENLQREDLSPFEEAEGYQALSTRHHYTHEEIAAAVGKSRTTVTEALALLKMPPSVRECVRALGIESRSILLEVQKLDNEDAMLKLLERISTLGMTRDSVRREVKRLTSSGAARAAKGAKRPRSYRFTFRAPDKRYKLDLNFRQTTVEPADLIQALEETLAELRRQQQADSEPIDL